MGGSEVENKSGRGRSKCVIAKIRIYTSEGEEFTNRPPTDKFFRPSPDVAATKHVKFLQPEIDLEEKVNKLEKMITEKLGKENETMNEVVANLERKLRRKQNENQNLIDNIEQLSKDEVEKTAEIFNLKEALDFQRKQCDKLADELALKTKEQLENVKVKDLESYLV